jgi:hypothetical protein
MLNINYRGRRVYRKKSKAERTIATIREMYSMSRAVLKLFRKAFPAVNAIKRTHANIKGERWK